jgi:hypothetical protein
MADDINDEQLPMLAQADYAYVAAVENGFIGFDGIVYQRASSTSSLTNRLFVPCFLSLQVLPEPLIIRRARAPCRANRCPRLQSWPPPSNDRSSTRIRHGSSPPARCFHSPLGVRQRYVSARWLGAWDSLPRGENVTAPASTPVPYSATDSYAPMRSHIPPYACTGTTHSRSQPRLSHGRRRRAHGGPGPPERAPARKPGTGRTWRVQACAPFARCYELVVSLLQVRAGRNARCCVAEPQSARCVGRVAAFEPCVLPRID